MPIYEFRCHNCRHEFEELVPIGQSAPCPECGRKPMRKISLFVAQRHAPIPEQTPVSTSPSVRMIGCQSYNNGGAGVHVGPGVHVSSTGGTYRDNDGPDVDNHGRFDSTDDRIG
jgi:putative FmdB family regulatory protein